MIASAAFTIVPPVSIMSSTSTHIRPFTSPTTRLATVSFGPVDAPALVDERQRGAAEARADQRSATLMRPASGETTASGWPPYLSRT